MKQWPQRSPGPRSSPGSPLRRAAAGVRAASPGNTGPRPPVLSEAPGPVRYIVRALRRPGRPTPPIAMRRLMPDDDEDFDDEPELDDDDVLDEDEDALDLDDDVVEVVDDTVEEEELVDK